jgi:integrase-like protein
MRLLDGRWTVAAGKPASASGHPDFEHYIGRGNSRVTVQDVKNAFQTALAIAEIDNFPWHDLRHTFASWLIMKGASLRAVAERLGHRGLRMVMRYVHLSPAYLSAEVSLLDAPLPAAPADEERATKGQTALEGVPEEGQTGRLSKKNGSSGRIRTYNPPVNSRMLCH